jgi:hypothetical protein
MLAIWSSKLFLGIIIIGVISLTVVCFRDDANILFLFECHQMEYASMLAYHPAFCFWMLFRSS